MLFVVVMALVLAALMEGGDYSAAAPAAAAVSTGALALVPPAAAGLATLYFTSKKHRLPGQTDNSYLRVASLAWRFRTVSKGLEFLALAAYGASLRIGWHAVPAALGIDAWALPAGAVLFAPFVVSLVLTWAVLHSADLALGGGGPTLAQRLSFKVRYNILTVCVPVAVILAFYDIFGLLPEGLKAPLGRPWVSSALGAAFIFGGYTMAPLVVVRVWKTSRLSDGGLRERLAGLCERLGVGFRDIRIWETPGHFFANAAVMGISRFVRYIIVSRSLLEAMPVPELEAVFAHELGHAKRRHMPYYLVLAADFMLLASLFETLAGSAVQGGAAGIVTWAFVFALYWGGGFGYVSRTFERDADLFAAETVGDHQIFANALARIAQFNAVSPRARSWRHGSILSRIEFLKAAAESSEVRGRFLKRLEYTKTFLVTTTLVALAAHLLLALAM